MFPRSLMQAYLTNGPYAYKAGYGAKDPFTADLDFIQNHYQLHAPAAFRSTHLYFSLYPSS
jgi:hypothetical protein